MDKDSTDASTSQTQFFWPHQATLVGIRVDCVSLLGVGDCARTALLWLVTWSQGVSVLAGLRLHIDAQQHQQAQHG